MKDRTYINEFLIDLEKRYPVERWIVDGFHIWPLLRIRLFFHILLQVEPKTKHGLVVAKEEKKDKKHAILDHWIVKRYKAKTKLRSYSNCKYLFAEAIVHRADYEGKSYSKLFDPIMDQLEGKCIIVEHSPIEKYDGLELYNEERIKFLYDLEDIFYYNQKLRKNVWKDAFTYKELEAYDSFISELKKNDLAIGFAEKHEENGIRYLARKFRETAVLYEAILDQAKPKIVFSVCFYTFQVMVLNHLAKKRGITTVEIQHGPQSEFHLGYANWTKVPKSGFNTMPDYICNWDEYSNKVNKKWSANTAHSSFVLGNPWVDYFRKFTIPQDSNIILFSLQLFDLEYLLRDFIVEMIQSHHMYDWWIRLHPRQLLYKEKVLEEIKRKLGSININIEQATSEPLPLILSKTQLHVTHNSGCTIEASQFGVPTIFIDKRGPSTFPDLVNEGVAKLALDIEEFKNTFDHFIKMKSSKDFKLPDYNKLFNSII